MEREDAIGDKGRQAVPDAESLRMTMSVPNIPRSPSLVETLGTMALALVLSVIVDSLLIIVGFAVASNFVEGMSEAAGLFAVMIMAFSVVIIWPVVLGPLVIVILARRHVAFMPTCLFVVGFAGAVTFVFDLFLYLIAFRSSGSFVDFATSAVMWMDGGTAFLIAGTFAIFFRMLSRRRPR